MKTIHLLLTLALLLTPMLTAAQGISTAVMEVRVEVVSGSSVERTDMEQLITFSEDAEEVIYGNFFLTLPEDVQIITSASEMLSLENGSETLVLNSTVNHTVDENGGLTLQFSAKSSPLAKAGTYSGKQIAEIFYF